jgi:N12 class adenine-specific DNA methylase
MIQDELELYETLLTKVESDDRVSRKRLERLKEGLKERLESLATRKDDLLTISEIGIDQIIVDEAQEFRKLSFATNMSTLKGVDPNGSQRAWDLFVKSRFVETKNPDRALVLASGTPITNTLGEMFSVQRYLGYPALFERGLHEFDAWASTFGDVTTELELQPSGKYKPVTRFATFANVPELIAMFRSFADVVMPEDLRRYVRSRRSRPASARSSPRSRRMPLSAIRPCSASASRRSRSATARRSPATTSCSLSSRMAGTPRSICFWSIRTTTTKPPIS